MFQKPRLQFHLHKVRRDARCLVHYFAKHFNEAIELVLGKLRHEMNGNMELYIRFGVYKSLEDFQIELEKYIFSKKYSNDTADLTLKLKLMFMKLSC